MTKIKFNMADYGQSINETIVDDMKITKLLYGLTQTGLDTAPFQTRIHNTVFMLAGIAVQDRTDELRDWYFKKIDQVLKVDINDEKKLFKIAGEILLSLNSWKEPETRFGEDL